MNIADYFQLGQLYKKVFDDFFFLKSANNQRAIY